MTSRRITADPIIKRKAAVAAGADALLLHAAYGGAYPEKQQQTAHSSLHLQQPLSPRRAVQPVPSATALPMWSQPRPLQKRRAVTAAQPNKAAAVAAAAAATGVVRRPHSGPLALGAGVRPRGHVAAQQPMWTSVSDAQPAPAAAALYLAEIAKPISSRGPVALQQQQSRAPLLMSNVSARSRSKTRAAAPMVALGSPVTVAPVATRAAKSRSRAVGPSSAASGARGRDAVVAAAATPYTNLSPSSAAAAAAAVAADAGARFDPFVAMGYDASPDQLLSVSARRFVVGKVQCVRPTTVRFMRDRLCYMFSHPQSQGTEMMMELHYSECADARCVASATGGGGTFSWKVPSHLPAFDSYGDYEPSLRSHRLLVEFSTQTELAKFKQMVLPVVLQQAIAGRR